MVLQENSSLGARRRDGRGLRRPALWLGAAAAVSLGALAIANRRAARRAEEITPPEGRFITVDGVRLHLDERGAGPAIVLLHGNGTMARDFAISGLVEQLAHDHRVIAFDRPGFGYSERPRHRRWTAKQQADLLDKALAQLGVDRAVVVGHSWGTQVALALAKQPHTRVSAIALLSGYYFLTRRWDVPLLSAPAIPVVGDLMRWTISPVLGRLMLNPVMRRLFAPASVDPRFADGFPLGLSLRPSQLRAAAEEVALMQPNARELSRGYHELDIPVAVVAGTGDRIVDFERQASRLARELPDAVLHPLDGMGHMIHYSATAEIVRIIRELAAANPSGARRQHSASTSKELGQDALGKGHEGVVAERSA